MNIRNIKASYLKASYRNYYLFNGYHITKIGSRYCLTFLFTCLKFDTLTELKKYIKNN